MGGEYSPMQVRKIPTFNLLRATSLYHSYPSQCGFVHLKALIFFDHIYPTVVLASHKNIIVTFIPPSPPPLLNCSDLYGHAQAVDT